MSEWRKGTTVAICVVAIASAACTRRRTSPSDETPEPPPADAKSAAGSWIVALARDTAPLAAMAETSPGWGKFFSGDALGALEAFEAGLDAGTAMPDVAVRIGAARAALELGEAHVIVGDIVAAATAELLDAQGRRPGAGSGAAWRAWIAARHTETNRGDVAAAMAKVPSESPAAVLAVATKVGAEGPVAALLRGEPAGIGAPLPAGTTSAYAFRLSLPALAAAGRLAEASKRLGRFDDAVPDIELDVPEYGLFVWRDPVVAGAAAQVYAARALKALGDSPGWLGLLAARAELLAGRPKRAAIRLAALIANPPKTMPLAMAVLGGALTNADLVAEARAWLVRALFAADDRVGATKVYAEMPAATSVERVARAWAGAALGEKVDPRLIPDRRTVLSKPLYDATDALGETATGMDEVGALSLVDRHVDALLCRFADALADADQLPFAAKIRLMTGDQGRAFEITPRNRLPALLAQALDNVRLGRPRPALKYLTRITRTFPPVKAPDAMLRDLLAMRGMDDDAVPGGGQ